MKEATERGRAVAKVRSLRALASSTTSHEAEAATTHANTLIVQHGLLEGELVDAAAPAAARAHAAAPQLGTQQLTLGGLGASTALARVPLGVAAALRAPRREMAPARRRAAPLAARAKQPPKALAKKPMKGPCQRCGKKGKRRADGTMPAHACPHRKDCVAFLRGALCALCDHERYEREDRRKVSVLRTLIRESMDASIRALAGYFKSQKVELMERSFVEDRARAVLIRACALAVSGSDPIHALDGDKLAEARYRARIQADAEGTDP